MAEDLHILEHHAGGGYGSEFDSESDADGSRERREDLARKPKPSKVKVASRHEVTEEYEKEERRKTRFHILSMDAFARHKKFINDYLQYFGGSHKDFIRDSSKDKTDLDIIRENHRFLWEDKDRPEESWEKRLAKKYYDKLFKEYCITDLKYYKQNKVAMRWQTEKEVTSGKGQFTCGSRTCEEVESLRTWEVNFRYVEHGEKKNALVKLRLCPDCSYKLNYHSRKREITQKRKEQSADEGITKKQKTDSPITVDIDAGEIQNHGGALKDTIPDLNKDKPSSSATDDNADIDNVWKKPIQLEQEKSRGEEFEEYFEDMFM